MMEDIEDVYMDQVRIGNKKSYKMLIDIGFLSQGFRCCRYDG